MERGLWQHQFTLSPDNGRYTLCTGAMLGAEHSINTTLCHPCNSQTQEVSWIFSSYKCGSWHIQRLTDLQSDRAHAPSQDSLGPACILSPLLYCLLKGFPAGDSVVLHSQHFGLHLRRKEAGCFRVQSWLEGRTAPLPQASLDPYLLTPSLKGVSPSSEFPYYFICF